MSSVSPDASPAGQPAQLVEPSSEPSTSYAPYRSIPKSAYASIEYPSTVSHPAAILRLVSQEDINDCFNTPASKATLLEVRLGGMDRSGVPIRGNRMPSQKLLLKLTRRRRRQLEDQEMGGANRNQEPTRKGAEEGIFTSEVVGPIPQTVRFRTMADWKYTPNPEGRTTALANALRDVDYDQILAYSVEPVSDTFYEPITPSGDSSSSKFEAQHRSLLDLQPIPVFSERRVPLIYNFKNHPATFLDKTIDERTGEVKKRYANRSRFVNSSLYKISHNHKPEDVPTKPKKIILEKIPELDPRILDRFKFLLEVRPVWARHALLAQFSLEDQRTIKINKYYFPAVVYTFGAGPFWKTVVRYGYDPCQDPKSAQWQRIYFYMNVQRNGRLQAVDEDSESEEDNSKGHLEWMAEQQDLVSKGLRPPIDPSREYIFDGQVLHRDQPDYQLCDITDPLIRKIIDDPNNLRDVCNPKTGWYDPAAMDHIKALTRLKYLYVRENNAPAPDEICHAAMLEYAKATKKLVAGEGVADEAEEEGEGNDKQGSDPPDTENMRDAGIAPTAEDVGMAEGDEQA